MLIIYRKKWLPEGDTEAEVEAEAEAEEEEAEVEEGCIEEAEDVCFEVGRV